MRAQWNDGETQEQFMIRILPELLDQATRPIVDNLQGERLTILDSGDGGELPTHVRNLTRSVVVLLEQVKNTTGVDLASFSLCEQVGSSRCGSNTLGLPLKTLDSGLTAYR